MNQNQLNLKFEFPDSTLVHLFVDQQVFHVEDGLEIGTLHNTQVSCDPDLRVLGGVGQDLDGCVAFSTALDVPEAAEINQLTKTRTF